MSLATPLNSGFSQPVNHFTTQSYPTCPRLDFFSLLQFCPAQDETGFCSRVTDCALMSANQSVETAALASFQLLDSGKTSLTIDEFIAELPKQLDDASLIRFVRNNKNVVISNDLKNLIILGEKSLHHLSDRTVQILIKKLNPVISYDTFVKLIDRYDSSVTLLRLMHQQGVPSQWFNTPDSNGRTALHKIARKGDIELINQIAKDIPKNQIIMASDLSFEEEMKDCFIQSGEVDLLRFDPTKTMVAQNGCRAVIMTDVGEIHSYPGQDASKLAQQLANGAGIDSFTIYHNRGHASISFSDAYFGFSPELAPNQANNDPVALAAKSSTLTSTQSGATLGMQFGSSSFTDSYKSKIAVDVPRKIWMSTKKHNQYDSKQPCRVTDDSGEKINSDMTNGLTLTVYAPKDKVEAVRQYAIKIQDACKAGDATAAYHALTNNCIDFVRKAVQASGSKADFRDSFHTMQYFRRPGIANFYTMFRSNQPIIHANASLLDATSIPEAVDRVSRNAVLGGLLSIPGVPYAYLVYKGIPRAIAAISRAGSRVQRAAVSIAGYAIVIGAILRARVL